MQTAGMKLKTKLVIMCTYNITTETVMIDLLKNNFLNCYLQSFCKHNEDCKYREVK